METESDVESKKVQLNSEDKMECEQKKDILGDQFKENID